MTRLIDADKVAKNVFDRIEYDLCWNTSPYVCDELEVCLPKEDYEYLRGLVDAQDCAVKTINEEPTVKAITIEWIDRFMNRFSTSEGVSGDEYALIHYMLCEWEKENEDGNV